MRCVIEAISKVTGITPSDLIEMSGHDGTEIIPSWGTMRGWTVEEMVSPLWYRGWALSPLWPRTVTADGEPLHVVPMYPIGAAGLLCIPGHCIGVLQGEYLYDDRWEVFWLCGRRAS